MDRFDLVNKPHVGVFTAFLAWCRIFLFFVRFNDQAVFFCNFCIYLKKV